MSFWRQKCLLRVSKIAELTFSYPSVLFFETRTEVSFLYTFADRRIFSILAVGTLVVWCKLLRQRFVWEAHLLQPMLSELSVRMVFQIWNLLHIFLGPVPPFFLTCYLSQVGWASSSLFSLSLMSEPGPNWPAALLLFAWSRFRGVIAYGKTRPPFNEVFIPLG